MRFTIDMDSLAAWCERLELGFARGEDFMTVELDAGASLYFTLGELDVLTIAARLPFVVPEERYAVVTQVLAGLNARIHMGSFMLNSEAGAIYFRLAAPTHDAEYGDQALAALAHAVASTAEACRERIEAAVFGAPAMSRVSAMAVDFWA